MSLERKRTETVYEIVRELVDGGRKTFLPGDVCSVLRERNQPMGAWLVRGEFYILEEQELIDLNPETGDWRLTGKAMRKTELANRADTGPTGRNDQYPEPHTPDNVALSSTHD